jgi:Asp-tRNA(Asn)/Glu-tRNA(Gln) amidotransferase A subunit family amidase
VGPRTPRGTSSEAAGPRRLTKSSFGFPIHPSVARAVADAGRILEEAGYDVSEVDPPSIIEASELWRNLLLTEVKTLQDADVRRLASPEMQRYWTTSTPPRNFSISMAT